MTGPNVEFLDEQPGGPTAEAPEPDAATSIRPRDWLAIGAWAVAAVLGAAACLTTLFTYRLDFSAVHSHGGYTATGHSLDPGLHNDRGTNYAVILAVCILAFLLVGAVVLRDARAATSTSLGRYAPAAGLAAVALLLGVLATLVLGLVSTFASYRTLADTLDRQQANAVQLSIGPCLWLGIAALAVAVAALVLTISRTGRPALLPGPVRPGDDPAPACGTPQQVTPRPDIPDN